MNLISKDLGNLDLLPLQKAHRGGIHVTSRDCSLSWASPMIPSSPLFCERLCHLVVKGISGTRHLASNPVCTLPLGQVA